MLDNNQFFRKGRKNSGILLSKVDYAELSNV